MVLKSRHILKVFKLYEGPRIYGYMSTAAFRRSRVNKRASKSFWNYQKHILKG